MYVVISNAICGGVVTPLSLELAQWYCCEGLFSMMAFSRAHLKAAKVPSCIVYSDTLS